MKYAIVFMILLLNVSCGPTAQQVEYELYLKERVVTKICRDGTRIYRWHDKFWAFDRTRYSDEEVSGPEACN